MSNAIICIDQRFAVKYSIISFLTSIFNLSDIKIKMQQAKIDSNLLNMTIHSVFFGRLIKSSTDP